MSKPKPDLSEPIKIAAFWKNRQRKESVRFTFSEYQGIPIINIRVYATGGDGIDRPTTKGIAMSVKKLPALAAGMRQALNKAHELGLVDDATAEATE